jgi:PHD/YefM family antitoxin component YafN of YafNO toxin-antitoxin module
MKIACFPLREFLPFMLDLETLNINKSESVLTGLLQKINQDHLPRLLVSSQGDAVIISKQEWENIQETLYLQSVPGLVASIKEAEENDDWVTEAEFMGALH